MKITLKAARVNAGYTQGKAAAAMGVSKDTVSNWERGKSFPNAPQIRAIESVYSVSFDDLIFSPQNTL